MAPIVIVVVAVAAVLLGAWATSTAIVERRASDRSARAVAGYGHPLVRDDLLRTDIVERVLAPLGRTLVSLGWRLTPPGYVESIKRKLVHAGNPAGYEVDRFLVSKVLALGSIPVWLALAYLVLDVDGLLAVLLVATLSGLAFFGPDILLERRIGERRRRIARALPDTLDLLVISVEAGLGFEQAVERTATAVPGPLSEETRRMLQETRMGASRADGLRALAERTQVDDVRAFVQAMLQADTFGVSVARVLRAQAEEMRIRRRQTAQELAQRAPIKMLFPLVLCIFPAIFVVLLLPAMIRIAESL